MADDVAVVFSAQIGQLIDGVAEVKEAVLSIAEPLAAVQESLGSFGEAFMAALAVEKIDGFFEHFAEVGTQTARNAALLGTATEQIGGLDIAAKASGGSLDELVHAMERLGASLANAEGGSEKAKAGLAALGISAKEFQALSPEAQLEKLAEKFSHLKDGINKDAIAMAIMGRSGADMIPILNQGAAGMRELQEMAERTGTALSDKTVAGMAATHHGLLELSKSFEGIGNVIASAFKPAFDGLVKILIDINEYFIRAVNQGGSMNALLKVLAGSADLISTALSIVVAFIETLWTTGKAMAISLANDFRNLGGILYDAMTFNLAGIKASWKDMMDSNKQVAITAASEMVTVEGNLMAELKKIWNNSATEHVKIKQDQDAHLKLGNKDVVTSAIAASEEQIKLADAQYAQEVEKINASAKLSEISERQKTQALLAALDQRRDAEMMALAQESEIAGLSETQHQKLLNEQLQLDQKYAADRQKIMTQAAEQDARTWKSGADQVAGAFNSQLRGLLSGTTSFAQAMKNIAGDMILKMIEDVDKWAIEWIAAQLRTAVTGDALKTAEVGTTAAAEVAKTSAVTAGAAARTTAETAGAGASIGLEITAALESIGASVARAFAGLTAFLVPVLGPAAPAGALAISAGIGAAAIGMIHKFDVGTDMVMSDGLAFIHRGETIVPAQGSGPYTGAGQGGNGGQVVFAPQLQALDQTGMQALINRMMPQFARALSQYQTLNPSTA